MSMKLQTCSQTDFINYDSQFKTFRLYAGNSLYAFCISPELTLEHLYWGKKLQDGFDLRYLSQSCRAGHFSTVEAAPLNFEGKILIEAETIQEVHKAWKENKVSRVHSGDDSEYYQKKRLENYSWRLLSKIQKEEPLQNRSRRNTYSNIEEIMESETQHRRRSVSNPVNLEIISEEIKSEITLKDLNLISKIKEGPPSTHRILDNLGANHGPAKKYKTIQTFERQTGKIGKGNLCNEYSDHGTGDFRTPSFIVIDNFNGSSISPLKFKSYSIYRGKLPLSNMPAIRSIDESDASTLVITMVDSFTGLEVDLIYVAMHKYDCITRRAVFRNADNRSSTDLFRSSKAIQKASSITIDFESSSRDLYMIHLSGSWARENYMIESKLEPGMKSFGSSRGISGHQHNPFCAISLGPPSETHGEVRGFALVYSGNFLVEAEVNETGRLRFNMGINPMGLQWFLKRGDNFETPEAVMIRSNNGIGGMSREFHRLILDRLIPKNWSDENPPILLNSWEAKYFHVNHDNIVEMARQASKIGIDLIVVDDGWFGKRNDDKSSLGDWIPNLDKFPLGMKGLSDAVHEQGCKFGLWFEPEMVSEESLLFSSHPDWYFHIPGRPRQMGRNQMVLDFSRADVRDYIFSALYNVLNNARIEYVKWDMNRPLTEVYSLAAGSEEVWQAEIAHRYILGVYELQNRITTTFPNILLENCASGGGRFDLGMLYYSPQVWCSDNTDGLIRPKIQYGTSLIYPFRCVGAHVSAVPNHITGSSINLRTRGFVAMSGTFGFELDVSISSSKDLLTYQKQIEVYKIISPIIRWGELYRLWNPFKLPLASWMFVSRDKSKAVVFAVSINFDHWNNLIPRLVLQGLDPEAVYEVSEPMPSNITQSTGMYMIIETEVPAYQMGVSPVHLTGDILMEAGLPVRFYVLDDSALFYISKI